MSKSIAHGCQEKGGCKQRGTSLGGYQFPSNCFPRYARVDLRQIMEFGSNDLSRRTYFYKKLGGPIFLFLPNIFKKYARKIILMELKFFSDEQKENIT